MGLHSKFSSESELFRHSCGEGQLNNVKCHALTAIKFTLLIGSCLDSYQIHSVDISYNLVLLLLFCKTQRGNIHVLYSLGLFSSSEYRHYL